jgi:hypothetical protein
MIVALLLLLVGAWLTWLLFRDEDSVDEVADQLPRQESHEQDRERRADPSTGWANPVRRARLSSTSGRSRRSTGH